MLEIPKQYILDEQQRPLAIQIPIDIFKQIEEILENFGLEKLMQEVEDDELLSGDSAYSYYQSFVNKMFTAMQLNLQVILTHLKQSLTELYGDRLCHLTLFGSQARGDAEPGQTLISWLSSNHL